MRPGPPPKPTVLRILQGNPGRKKINTREPMPEPIAPPVPPEHLPLLAKEKWRELAEVLCRLRILTVADTDVLEIYCAAYARKRDCDQFIRERGLYFPVLSDDGKKIRQLQQYPHVSISEHCAAVMVQIGDRLGLNPAMRSRLQVPPDVHGPHLVRDESDQIAERLLS